MADMRDSGYHWSGQADQGGQPEWGQPGDGDRDRRDRPYQAPPSPWAPGGQGWNQEEPQGQRGGWDRPQQQVPGGAAPAPTAPGSPEHSGWGHGQTARGPAWGPPGGRGPAEEPYQAPGQYRPQPGPGSPYGPQPTGPYGHQGAAPFAGAAPYLPPGPGNGQPGTQPDLWNEDHRGPGSSRRKPRYFFAASLAATALVAGGLGAGIALAVDGSGNNANSASATSTPPSTVPKGTANANGAGGANAGNSGQGGNVDVAGIANQVEPAVVDIYASGPQGQDEGTGMIISSSGLVLTNNHVIAGSTQLSAQINGAGKKYTTTVVGADPTDDVALLQLHGRSNFSTVRIGDSSQVGVGTPVVAIGNALGLPGPETVTNGIISATSRSISVSDPSTGATEHLKGVFQTSAPINPGNSGGPLLNGNAQVIGINTAAASSSAGNAAASNVGFAIPVNRAMSIVHQIEAGKASSTIYLGQRAIIGIDVTTVACAEGQAPGCPGLGANPFSPFGYTPYQAPVKAGAVVQQIEQGTPAAKAGLGAGDVITSVNGNKVTSITQLTKLLAGKKVGQSVELGWVGTSGNHHSASIRLIAGPNV